MTRYITLEEELRNCPAVRKQDVQAVLEWAKKQPHLPNFDKVSQQLSVFIAMAIKRRYNSIERAKETLDSIFTFRTLVPEISINRTLDSPEVKQFFSISYMTIMDKRDCEGNLVIAVCFNDPDPSNFDFNAYLKCLNTVIETWMWENGSGGAPGMTLVFDQKNMSMGYVLRTPLSAVKKTNYYLKECTALSVKNVHIINATNVMQAGLSLFKPIIYGQLFQKTQMFTSSELEKLYEFVPKDALPNEYGGTGGSFKELHERSLARIERQKDLLNRLDRLKVDESKRRGPPKNDGTLFGLEGSFKKLDVD